MATPTILLRNNPAYKASKLLGYNPYGTRFIPIEMDFARSSSGSVEKSTGIVNMGTGVPRVDVNGSVLLEPARTNLLRYSEQFDNAAWIKTGITTTANDIVSPDGATTADKLETNADGARFAGQNVLLTNATVYQATCYLQNGNTGWGAIAVADGVSDIAVGTFNLATGVVGSTSLSLGSVAPSLSIEDAGNGWYRCILQFTSTSTGIWNFRVYSSAQGIADVSGVIGEFTYAWGAQLEAGSYPTSYIKTEGSTVTRTAETLSKTGLATELGDSEGTIYFEGSFSDVNSFVGLSDGTSNNRVTIGLNASSNLTGSLINSGIIEGVFTLSGNVSQTYKMALSYSANRLVFYIDGVKIGEDNSVITYSDGTLTRLGFDDRGSNPFYGNVQALAVYDTALSDTELAILTTL